MTRIVAWNIMMGGGDRIEGIADALASLDPSVVVLTEVTGGRVPEVAAALARVGIPHSVDSVAGCADPKRRGVLIASTTKPEVLPWTTAPNESFEARVLRAQVGDLAVMGILAPSTEDLSPAFYEWLVPEAHEWLGDDAFIIGDFNAGHPGEVNVHEYFMQLVDDGWADALRLHSPEADATSHWISSGGVALDHCLVAGQLRDRVQFAEIPAELNGMPTAARADRRTLFVEPDGPGFLRLTVIDARGAADSVMVRLQ